ncbi:MAG: J domain-containing protein, partial [Planctomycetes bacterium]|nr:J domain-containing protein [Planctomycetota bacterium]
VLKVEPSATLPEIRASFKRLMLKNHPDKNPGRRAWAERSVRELIEAFEVLSNPRTRAAFDLQRAAVGAARGESRRSKAEPYYFSRTDPRSRARLILHYLLHRRPRAAVTLVREMEARLGTEYLAKNLDPEDYLDCLFLLGEFHAGRREYLTAVERLEAFCLHEKGVRRPRHYVGQVVQLLKDLYLRKIPRDVGGAVALEGRRAAVDLGLSKAEESLRLRRMAEILVKTGDLEEARRILRRAQTLFPLSKDVERIRRTVEAAG